MRKFAVALGSLLVLCAAPAFAGGVPSGNTTSIKTSDKPAPVKKKKHHRTPKAKPVMTPTK